jgi:phosphotransferase system enzyme I (PtsI)
VSGAFQRLAGIGASPGIAIGRAHLLDRRRVKTPKNHIPPEAIEVEVARLEAAIRQSYEQLDHIKQRLKEAHGEEHFRILEAHQLILNDEHLVVPAKRFIREEQINAEWALRRAVEDIKSIFDRVEDDYFRERRSDVDFVGDRILRNLLGENVEGMAPPPDAVVVAHNLSPADTAQLHRAAIAGFVTDAGGITSHAAIMARSFEIPAVVGLDDVTSRVGTGDLIIVDGARGEVLLNPPPSLVLDYRARARRRVAIEQELLKNRELPAETPDGTRVGLLANVELLDEIPGALNHGAEGIGLYRTEFLFMNRADLPREEEHLSHTRAALERLGVLPATFRTCDLGGDKATQIGAPLAEPNPALGMRSIRLCLKERDLFKTQLRGLLRASPYGKMRLMFPMISGVGELREAKAVLAEVTEELRQEGKPFAADIPVGIMIELPAAAMTADLLAREADFFSIGTNDLIQFALAADRVNEHVGYLYRPLHPAILRMVRFVVDAAHAAGIPVAMCGEMAGDPSLALVLLGLGLDELSMNPTAIPLVKSIIRGLPAKAARDLALKVLDLPTPDEIEAAVREVMSAHFPEEMLRGRAEEG